MERLLNAVLEHGLGSSKSSRTVIRVMKENAIIGSGALRTRRILRFHFYWLPCSLHYFALEIANNCRKMLTIPCYWTNCNDLGFPNQCCGSMETMKAAATVAARSGVNATDLEGRAFDGKTTSLGTAPPMITARLLRRTAAAPKWAVDRRRSSGSIVAIKVQSGSGSVNRGSALKAIGEQTAVISMV